MSDITLADGTLDPDRWQSFQKLQGEMAHEVRKEDPRAAIGQLVAVHARHHGVPQ